jgi:excinuclease UvrABC helicase subunit UvrB
MEQTGGVFAEQVIRPTGLIDPPVEIRPTEDQVPSMNATKTRRRRAIGLWLRH